MIEFNNYNTCPANNNIVDDFVDGEIHNDNQVLKLQTDTQTHNEWLYNIYMNTKGNSNRVNLRKHNPKCGQNKAQKKNYCSRAYVFTSNNRRVKFSLFEPTGKRRKINVVANPTHSNIIITQFFLLKLGAHVVNSVEKCNHTCHFNYKEIFVDFNTWGTHPVAVKNDKMRACFCLPLTHMRLKAADATFKDDRAPSLQIFKKKCTLCGLCEVNKTIVNKIFRQLIFELCDIDKTKFMPHFSHLAL